MARKHSGKDGWKSQRCANCMWLTQPYDGSSCQEAGVGPNSSACEFFEYLDPLDWLENHPVNDWIREQLKRPACQIPRTIKAEIKDIGNEIQSLELPDRLDRRTGDKLQRASARASAYRSRLTTLIQELGRCLVAISATRESAERQMALLKEIKALKTQKERDQYVGVVCERVDYRLSLIGYYLNTCRDHIKSCDAIHKAADTMIRAVYAMKDKEDR